MPHWKKDEIFRKQAREAGYRSRAAFKLIEIENRYHILKNAKRVVDLCSAPGSWLQVVKEHCKHLEGEIIGVDIAPIKPIPGVKIIQSSIDSPELVSSIMAILKKPAQVVLSDCSPKLTGNKTVDRERQLWHAQLSLQHAFNLLERTGHFVTKIFQSAEFQTFISRARQYFNSVKTFKPKSSFKRSPEMYLIAKSFRGPKKIAINQDAS